jgi:hypothetical protein
MHHTIKIILFALVAVSSFTCMVLLFRGYTQRRVQLLLWSAFCFVGLTVNNILVFIDLVIWPGPEVDLRIPRLLASLAGLNCLVYGLIWKTERERE